MSNPQSRNSSYRAPSNNQSNNQSRPIIRSNNPDISPAQSPSNAQLNQSNNRVIRNQPVNDQLRFPANRQTPLRSPIPTINQSNNQSNNQSPVSTISHSQNRPNRPNNQPISPSNSRSVERQPLLNKQPVNQSQRPRPQPVNPSANRPVNRPNIQHDDVSVSTPENSDDTLSADQSMFARRVHINGRNRGQQNNQPINPPINPALHLPKRPVRGGPAYTGILIVIITLTLLIVIHKLSQSFNQSTDQTALIDHKHDHSFPGKIDPSTDPSLNQYVNAAEPVQRTNNQPIIEPVQMPDLPVEQPVKQSNDQSNNQPIEQSNNQVNNPPSNNQQINQPPVADQPNNQPIAPPVTLPVADQANNQPINNKPAEQSNIPPTEQPNDQPPPDQVVDPLQQSDNEDPAIKLLQKLNRNKESFEQTKDQSANENNQAPPMPPSINQALNNEPSKAASEAVKRSALDTTILQTIDPSTKRTLLQHHEMSIEKLPYHPSLDPSIDQPLKPFALNGPDSHLNEERRDLLSDSLLTVSMPGQIATSLCSPGARGVCADIGLNAGGDVMVAVKKDGQTLIEEAVSAVSVYYKACQFSPSVSVIGVAAKSAAVEAKLYSGSSYWRPVPGAEKRYNYADYNSLILSCKGNACRNCPVKIEIRVYEHAVAIRHLVNLPDRDTIAIMQGMMAAHKAGNLDKEELNYLHVQHVLDVKLPSTRNYACWGNSQEEPYVEHPCASMPETMTPITIVSANKEQVGEQRFMSLLQADGPNFMRSVASGSSSGVDAMQIMSKGEILMRPQEGKVGVLFFDESVGLTQPTDWHVMLFTDTIGGLLENNHIVPLLCPPPNMQLTNMADTRWVGFGKSIRERRFAESEATEMALEAIDFAQKQNFQTVHFDAGWYGDEYSPKSSALDVFSAFKPYLNMTTIGLNATARGVMFTVYVNELALRDTPDLARLYSQEWHIHGVKFGFVNTLTPRAMRILAERIITFGKFNMFINVHDLYRPKGWSRTWPHLVAQEGIRGEERKPEADHHTQLAFTRFIQGAADYTPRYLKGSGLLCTRTHQLALPIIFFSPIQSMYWAHPFKALRDAVEKWNPELVMWKMLPTVWDDTRVLSGMVSSHAVIARRAGQEWFIGCITNNAARTIDVNLTALFVDRPGHPRSLLAPPIKGYLVHVYSDNADINPEEYPERNLIPQNHRVTYHIPASMSSSLEVVSPVHGMPSDSVEYVRHLQNQAAERSRIWKEHDEWMINVKHIKVQREGPFPPIGQPILTVPMPPSGGAVIYVQPFE